MQFELVETINGKEVVTAEFPANSLKDAQEIAAMMMPTHLPAKIRLANDEVNDENYVRHTD